MFFKFINSDASSNVLKYNGYESPNISTTAGNLLITIGVFLTIHSIRVFTALAPNNLINTMLFLNKSS